jgi:hypothetical protein
MAYLQTVPLDDAKSNKFLEKAGFTNVQTTSSLSVWRANVNHVEFWLLPCTFVQNPKDLAHVAFAQGIRIGGDAERELIRERINKQASAFLKTII